MAVPNNSSRAHDKKTPFEPWEIQLVLLDITGYFTAEDLAKKFNTSAVVVTRRLRDAQADVIREEAKEKIKANLQKEIVDEIPGLVKLAIAALKKTLEAEIHPLHKAKPNQDKVALAVAIGSGVLKPSNADEEFTGGVRMSPEQHKGIVEALEKSAKVRELHAIPIKELVMATESNGNGQNSRK